MIEVMSNYHKEIIPEIEKLVDLCTKHNVSVLVSIVPIPNTGKKCVIEREGDVFANHFKGVKVQAHEDFINE